jgi:hypothetical protein
MKKLKLRKLSTVIETRLIGVGAPSKEETKAIKEFETKRKSRKMKLVPLSKIK